MIALPGLQMTGAALVAESGQTLSSFFTVEPEPRPNRVVVKKKGRSDIRVTHSLAQQCKRVGASSQTMRDQAVPSQLDQLCLSIVLKNPAQIMPTTGILSKGFCKIFSLSQ